MNNLKTCIIIISLYFLIRTGVNNMSRVVVKKKFGIGSKIVKRMKKLKRGIVCSREEKDI